MPKCAHCPARRLRFACPARARPHPRLCQLADPAHPDRNRAYDAVTVRWCLEDRAPLELDDRPGAAPDDPAARRAAKPRVALGVPHCQPCVEQQRKATDKGPARRYSG